MRTMSCWGCAHGTQAWRVPCGLATATSTTQARHSRQRQQQQQAWLPVLSPAQAAAEALTKQWRGLAAASAWHGHKVLEQQQQ
jgi:hypothetical protein